MLKIKIKKGLVVTQGDNTVTVVKNDPIKKTVSIEILNAITGETLPANLTHTEFTEKYLSDDVAADSNKIEEVETLPRIKMVDGSIHTHEWFDASVELTCIVTGRVQTVTGDCFNDLVETGHVKIV
jgi:hypothetical protein